MPLRYFCILLLLVVSTFIPPLTSETLAAKRPMAQIKNGLPIWETGRVFKWKTHWYKAVMNDGKKKWKAKIPKGEGYETGVVKFIYHEAFIKRLKQWKKWQQRLQDKKAAKKEVQDFLERRAENKRKRTQAETNALDPGNNALDPDRIRDSQELFLNRPLTVTLIPLRNNLVHILSITGNRPAVPLLRKKNLMQPSTIELLRNLKSTLFQSLYRERNSVVKRVAGYIPYEGIRRTEYPSLESLTKSLIESINGLTRKSRPIKSSLSYTNEELLWAMLKVSNQYNVIIPEHIMRNVAQSNPERLRFYLKEGERLTHYSSN